MHDRIAEAADTRELVDHHVALVARLGGVVDVLEMAPAAAARAEMRAARLDTMRRWLQERRPGGEGVAAPVVRQPREDALAGNGVRHEDRAPGVAPQRLPAVDHLIERQFKRVVGHRGSSSRQDS